MNEREEAYPAKRPEENAVCPSHPGAVLKGLYLDELGVTIGDFARSLGVSRKAVSMIVNERKSVTPEMALRFAKALDTAPRLWINLQSNYDLWQAKHEKPGFLDSIKRVAAVL